MVNFKKKRKFFKAIWVQTACYCHVTYAFQSESTLYTVFAWMSRNSSPVSSKDFLDIQDNIECGFTLKRVRDMTKTYSQMHRTDKYSQHSSTIWPVWLNGWVFVHEVSGCGFESSCSQYEFILENCYFSFLVSRQ